MKTIDKIITKLNCKFGAPMGRSNIGDKPTDKRILREVRRDRRYLHKGNQ